MKSFLRFLFFSKSGDQAFAWAFLFIGIILPLILCLLSCTSALKAPKAYVRPANQMLEVRATLQDAELSRPVLYFASFDTRVEQYRVEYSTKSKVPFLTVFKPKSSIKDTIRAAPCYVRVQAIGSAKSKWSEYIYVD